MQKRWKKNPGAKKNLSKLIPLQRIGKPNDIANATNNWIYDSFTTFNTDCNYPSGCLSNTISIQENTISTSIFPNPTRKFNNVQISGYKGPIIINIYDLSGRLLNSTNNTVVSIEDYVNGIYIFSLSYGDKNEDFLVVKE